MHQIRCTATELPYSGKSIYFDTTFLNKYVYFEVIPICPITGFSGEAVRSAPILITYQPENDLFNSTVNWDTPTEDLFKDITAHWGKDYINTLAQSDIISGRSDDTFAPDEEITRAEFSKMLAAAFSVNSVSDDLAVFSDISKDDWYYNHVTALYLAGIINGTSDVTFSPDELLTREQAVTMAIRLYEKATSSTASVGQISFADEGDISQWALIPTKKANRLNIIKGFPDGTFAPKESLTRAQAAVIIYNLANLLDK